MSEAIHAKGITSLFFAAMLNDGNPVPRVYVSGNPGFEGDARRIPGSRLGVADDYSRLAVKAKSVSRNAWHVFKQPADGVICTRCSIPCHLAAGLVEMPFGDWRTALTQQ